MNRRILNANMWQRSAIQQMTEMQNTMFAFKTTLNKIMECYNVQNNIFGIISGTPLEITSGYFIVESEYDNFDEAMRNFDINSNLVRIVENKKFYVGTYANRIADVEEGKIAEGKVYSIEEQSTICE